MMWLKYLFLILLFYFLAILQSSFLVYFNILGAVPSFIFILFFLLVFFNKTQNYYENLFAAILAGFLLDIFNSSFLGISIILLIIINFFIEKLLSNLKYNKDDYPLIYFVPIFVVSLIIYQLVVGGLNFSWVFVIDLAYNLVFALIGFFIFKILFGKKERQLSLNI